MTTLLLAEDEALIVMLVEEALTEAGYEVVTASDGHRAMAALEERHAEFAGIVTDIRLGAGPSGWELASRARELNPHLPVVYFSGDSAHEWPAKGVPKSLMLQKPFADAQLVTAISQLLNEAAVLNIPPPDGAGD